MLSVIDPNLTHHPGLFLTHHPGPYRFPFPISRFPLFQVPRPSTLLFPQSHIRPPVSVPLPAAVGYQLVA